MTTVSVPLSSVYEEQLKHLIKSGYGSNKADVIRRAIARLAEEEAVMSVLRAEQEIRDGKMIKGDLAKILKRI